MIGVTSSRYQVHSIVIRKNCWKEFITTSSPRHFQYVLFQISLEGTENVKLSGKLFQATAPESANLI